MLVALLLLDLVPLDDVVEAVGIAACVCASAATADGVLHRHTLLTLASAKHHLRVVGAVPVAVVWIVVDVVVVDAVRVGNVGAILDLGLPGTDIE